MLPSIIDGTIPVWKRILLSTHIYAGKDFVKSANIFGQTIAHWHPHSEAIEGSAESLVQNDFLCGKGNWGSTIGIEPMGCAAPRYTELRMNELIENIAFKYVEDVEWKEDELDSEPPILPAMIPLCLFAKYELNMIGFGFKTEMPQYKLSDVVRRLLFLLGNGPKIIIKPNIQGCKIKSPEADLEKLLNTKGKHAVEIEGTYTTDEKNFRIYIHGWSPRSNFTSIFSRIDGYRGWNLLSNGDVSFIDESTDAVGTKIRFEVNKARNRDQIYQKMFESISDRLSSSISYHMFAVAPDMKIVETCVDDMLMTAYRFFVSTLNNHFRRKIKEVTALISELEIIKKIRPHIPVVYNLPEYSEVIKQLSARTGITEQDIENVVNKYRIRKILTVKIELDECHVLLAQYKEKLKNIEQTALEHYQEILEMSKEQEKEEDKVIKSRASSNKIAQITPVKVPEKNSGIIQVEV